MTKASAPMVAEEEDRHLLQVEQALLKLLNDDIAEADKILKQQNSSYHHLGRGISSFISSMLAAEKELMKDAASILQTAENKTWEDMKTAQKSPTAFQSHIYPPGTEYLLCYASKPYLLDIENVNANITFCLTIDKCNMCCLVWECDRSHGRLLQTAEELHDS